MIPTNAAKNAALNAEPPFARRETSQDSLHGWDPYEVWRTRVLLPRLEEQRLADRPADNSILPFVARSA